MSEIENSRNWFEKKDVEFLSTGFDTEFSGGSFCVFLIFKVTFPRGKTAEKFQKLLKTKSQRCIEKN